MKKIFSNIQKYYHYVGNCKQQKIETNDSPRAWVAHTVRVGGE